MQDDFDLEGLSPAEASAYVTQFIVTQKQVARDRAAAEEVLELWKKRARLATDRDEIELARESLARAEEAHANLVRLRSDEREMNFKVTELKRRLVKIRQEPEFTVNAGALLEQIGVRYAIVPTALDELALPGEEAEDYVLRDAIDTARAGRILTASAPHLPILGADTAVVVGNRILGKPSDADDAAAMLRLLSGRRRSHRRLGALSRARGTRCDGLRGPPDGGRRPRGPQPRRGGVDGAAGSRAPAGRR